VRNQTVAMLINTEQELGLNSAISFMNLIQTDRNRLVVGLGATGLSTMRFLQRAGLPFSALDSRVDLPNKDSLCAEFVGVDIYLGDAPAEVFERADELYVSPGLALDTPELEQAAASGALISGDLDLFMRNVDAPVIAITGSNAKSTVTTLVGELLASRNLHVGVGGNLGTPMLDLIERDCDVYVLELSSFQLERAHHYNFSVACVLNVSADHMDRHKTMLRYHQLKQRVYSEAKVALFNRDDRLTYPLQRAGLVQKSFGQCTQGLDDYSLQETDGQEYIVKGVERVLAVDAIALPGRHNVLNVMAALAIVDAAGFDMQGLAEKAAQFRGLPHRCELVGSFAGVRYINDSKATNVGACVAAINGFSAAGDQKIIVLAGGQTKSADFQPLATVVEKHACKLVLFGEGAEQIGAACAGCSDLHYAQDLLGAVHAAHALAEPGDLVLLSPACASFDMFSNYEERGDVFRKAVNDLINAAPSIGVER